MFIVSVTVRGRVASFQFRDWLLSFFCFVASRFSCSVTILGLGSFLVPVLPVLYIYDTRSSTVHLANDLLNFSL